MCVGKIAPGPIIVYNLDLVYCNIPINQCDGGRYRHGTRGRMRSVIITLLNEYHRVEEIFQGTLPR